ncbi:MAG: hypothetical protein KAR25_05985 [Methanosarcinales archaeon]|nr:hypothetical protein [Methanosarcinales archaeon]
MQQSSPQAPDPLSCPGQSLPANLISSDAIKPTATLPVSTLSSVNSPAEDEQIRGVTTEQRSKRTRNPPIHMGHLLMHIKEHINEVKPLDMECEAAAIIADAESKLDAYEVAFAQPVADTRKMRVITLEVCVSGNLCGTCDHQKND